MTRQAFPGTTNSRYLRALVALMNGQLTREQLVRIADASNGPSIPGRLRRYLELHCRLVRTIDRDGRNVSYGDYSLTPSDRHIVQRAFFKVGRFS